MVKDNTRWNAQFPLCLALVFAFPTLGIERAHTTVLEFDAKGAVVVTEAQNKPLNPTSPGKTGSQYRNLAQDVALRFSGSEGVRKAGLDAFTFVDVFQTLIERESAYDPEALSEKGAMGLGQLMPDTASDMGVDNPFDPRANLVGSVKYFTTLLNEFGSLELALAAYNAGPQRVRDHKGVPPFKETREYISWISSKVGLDFSETKSAPQNGKPTSTENPLNGDVSVWEF